MKPQAKYNIKLLVVFCVLAIISAILFVYEPGNDLQKGQPIFGLNDIESIQMVTIARGEEKIELKKSEAGWRVNEKYACDNQLLTTLWAVFQYTEKFRLLPDQTRTEIFETKGTDVNHVEVKMENGSLAFDIAGNNLKTQSYISMDGKAFVVHIPGYDGYICGLFEISANDWTEHGLFSADYRNIDKLEYVNTLYPEHNLNVSYQDGVLLVDGLSDQDTVSVYNFVNAITSLKADKILAKPDSALSDQLIFSLVIDKMGDENQQKASFYHFDDRQLYVPLDANRIGLISKRNVAFLDELKDKSVFLWGKNEQ